MTYVLADNISPCFEENSSLKMIRYRICFDFLGKYRINEHLFKFMTRKFVHIGQFFPILSFFLSKPTQLNVEANNCFNPRLNEYPS